MERTTSTHLNSEQCTRRAQRIRYLLYLFLHFGLRHIRVRNCLEIVDDLDTKMNLRRSSLTAVASSAGPGEIAGVPVPVCEVVRE